MCGEQHLPYHQCGSGKGSPPRVRGTGIPPEAAPEGLGITPACAGNSIRRYGNTIAGQDHPRVCGEQCKSFFLIVMSQGSPPRVRGTAALPVGKAVFGRITPACAGNSTSSTKSRISRVDHPRVCGEQFPPGLHGGGWRGSPPRVRGTGTNIIVIALCRRITPACAGNRAHKQFTLFDRWDHPRVCGEQSIFILLFFVRLGSPPRVRGTVSNLLYL